MLSLNVWLPLWNAPVPQPDLCTSLTIPVDVESDTLPQIAGPHRSQGEESASQANWRRHDLEAVSESRA
jgi:hypothetical protein